MQKQWPFLAGIIDGDGTISAKNGTRVDLRVNVSTSDSRMLHSLTSHYGGKVYIDRGVGGFSAKRAKYKWYPSGNFRTEDILVGILPYLVLKREQASLAIRFLSASGSDLRRQIALKIQALNRPSDAPKAIVKSLPDDAIAYLAGIFESEGSISICKNQYSVRCSVSVYNTSESLMRWLIAHFGGRYFRREPRKEGWLASYMWDLSGRKNRQRVLAQVLPYLSVKRDSAIAVLSYLGRSNRRDALRFLHAGSVTTTRQTAVGKI